MQHTTWVTNETRRVEEDKTEADKLILRILSCWGIVGDRGRMVSRNFLGGLTQG